MSTNEGGRPDPLPRTPHAALTQPDSPHGPCERVIETVLSRLYVFPDAIYKWYRPTEAYYGNVRDMPHRRVFFTNDFE